MAGIKTQLGLGQIWSGERDFQNSLPFSGTSLPKSFHYACNKVTVCYLSEFFGPLLIVSMFATAGE